MSSIRKIKYPIAIEWPIPEHRLKELKDKPGKILRSDSFTACGVPKINYNISIHSYEPGHELHGDAYICFHLDLSDNTMAEANFNLAVESANYRIEEDNYNFMKSQGRGAKCCTIDELFDPEKNFISNGQLTVKMNGTLIFVKEDKIQAWNGGNSDDLEIWEQDGDKDFTVEVAGKEISVSSLYNFSCSVLAASSPFFAKMFESGEAEEDKAVIKDFKFYIVEKAIKLCYHRSLVVTKISHYDAMKLLQIFDKYDIQSIKNDLEKYLISTINESTVCELANCSLASNAVKLKKECYKFLQACLKTKPVADLKLLNTDFAMDLFKNSFFYVSK